MIETAWTGAVDTDGDHVNGLMFLGIPMSFIQVASPDGGLGDGGRLQASSFRCAVVCY